MEKRLETQVLVIGAGSTGLAIARELSRYNVDVTVVEKNVDVCFGEVKASHGQSGAANQNRSGYYSQYLGVGG